MQVLTNHLPQGSIYVGFIDECCLNHDKDFEGDEKMVSGHLFYNPKHKQFAFFSTFIENSMVREYDERKLHIWNCASDFDPQKPTFAQAYKVMEFRFHADVAANDGLDCTLEDIWMVNHKDLMYFATMVTL